jgi:hypothetical protein
MADHGWPEALVFDQGPHGPTTRWTHVPIPGVLIRPCSYPELRVQVLVLTDPSYQLQVSPRNADGFEPVSYHWDFGDGTTEDTTAPTVTHDYWRMPEATADVAVLIEVTATDARGQALTGYQALDWTSMEFSYRAHGYRYVHSRMIGDRTVDTNGVPYQDYLLWHHEDAPVVLDRAALDPAGPFSDLSWAATLAGAPPSGQIAIPPGEQLRVTVHHDFSHDDASFTAANLWLTNGDSQPVLASVTVFKPL